MADSVGSLLLPNSPATGGRALRTDGDCTDGSAGSLIKLEVGTSCQFSKPPFTIIVRCLDAGDDVYEVRASTTASIDGWIAYDKPRAAGEEVPFADMWAAVPQSNAFIGPVLATPAGESLTLGGVGAGVHSLADCWASIYAVG